MLVLTRKMDEQILIGSDIKVTLVRVKGNTVRLGIEAPDNVRVLRGELQKHSDLEDDAENRDGMATVFAHPTEIPGDTPEAGEDPALSDSETLSRTPVNSTLRDWRRAPHRSPSVSQNGQVVRPYDAREANAKMNAAPLSGYMSAT